MKKIIALLVVIISTIVCLHAQNNDTGASSSYYNNNNTQQQPTNSENLKQKPSFKSRLRFGGNIGAAFGSTISYVQLAPAVGYAVTNNFILGVGLTYYYQWYKKSVYPARHMYGGRVFARQYFLRELFNNTGALFVHAEYEPLSVPYYNPNTEITNREILNTVYLGGGIIINHFTVSALYIVNYDSSKSIYNNPLQIRLGVFF